MTSMNLATYRAGHEAFNRRDFDAMVKDYAGSIVWTDRARSLTYSTPQEFKKVFLAGWVRSSTDIRIVDPLYVDAGQTVLSTFSVVGTHDGPLGPFPATNKEFCLPLCEMWHFDTDGRVVGGDLYYDQVTLLLQLGLMPQPSAVA
jgi:SnoaL-like domain